MTGSIGTVDRCPECGAAFAEVGILPPGRGHRSLTLGAIGFVLIIIAVGCMGTSMLSLMYARAQQQEAQARQAAAILAQQQAAAAAARALTSDEAPAADQDQTEEAPDPDAATDDAEP